MSSAPRVRSRILRRCKLMRSVDRVEAGLFIATVIVVLLLLPVALAMGSESYANQSRLGDEQSLTRHPATATLLADAPPVSYGMTGQPVVVTSDVVARWTLPDGTLRDGTVPASHGSKAGQPVSIWLDRAGDPVAAPITHDSAAMGAIAIALGTWAAAAGALGGLFLLVRFGLNRYRSAAWQREWSAIEPGWSHR